MMKIAVFTDTYTPQMNGVVCYLSDSLGLLSRKNEIVLFAPGEGPQRTEKVSENFTIQWIPSAPFPFYHGYRIASLNYKRISNMLAKENPDIVHVHAPVVLGLQGVISSKRKKLPIIVTYHTHFPDYLPHLLNGKIPGFVSGMGVMTVKKLIKHVFKRADIVTAPTNELVEELESYGLKNVEYLPNGVDLGKIKTNETQKARFMKKYNIPKNKKTIIYLGRISFEKKLDMLLHAFKRIDKTDRLLLIVGGGPYLERLKKIAAELEINCVFTGFIDKKDIGTAYACADIFVSASDTETFGLTFVEAMHMGLPLIGARKFGAKELINDNKNGILIEPGDELGLADAMDRLLKNKKLCERLGKNAVQVAKRYTLENSVKKTVEIYKRLINNRRKQK